MATEVWPEVEKALNENRHELVLSGCEISKRILNSGLDLCIFQVTTLNYLDIHDVNLTSLPEDISKLNNLQSLVLHSNKLKTIPEGITKLGKLKLLDLSKNLLEKLPESLNNLSNLNSLNLFDNQLKNAPNLTNFKKLSVIDLSHNQLKEFPAFDNDLTNLSEIKLDDNQIEEIPVRITKLPSLKVLELKKNLIKTIPAELGDCGKLKTLDLKENPINDRRLLKLIDQCRTKQILDYIKRSYKRNETEKVNNTDNNKEEIPEEKVYKNIIKIQQANDSFKIIISDNVKNIREHLLGCIVNNIKFTNENFKKFLQIQNKLHDTICNKRNSSTIATHDFNKLPPGDLIFTTLPPNELVLHPLNRPNKMTGAELFHKLQTEANNLRKERKRNTYSSIHKYLSLIEGHPRYPCILNGKNEVISFPPITNSDITKIDLQTTTILIEVTSSLSQHACKTTLDSLLMEMVELFGNELIITQLRTTTSDGKLRAIYPSKCDLVFESNNNNTKVVRE